jgi:hypothetical protein
VNLRQSTLVGLTVLALPLVCPGQDLTSALTYRPEGISIQGGIGSRAIRDESISQEKYSGKSSWIQAGWSHASEASEYRINLSYEKAPELKNQNVTAELNGGGFEVVILYPIGPMDVFGTRVTWTLGPAGGLYTEYRKQHIAETLDGSGEVYSTGTALFELGARIEACAPFTRDVRVETALQSSLLSVGGGTRNNANEASMAFMTPLTGVHASFDFAVRYAPFTFLSCALGYRLKFLRIDSWNYILSASDNVFISLTMDV